jgi:cytochrome c oxidase subunit 2
MAHAAFCSYQEALLAEIESNPLRRPLPDGIVPEDEVTRTEERWIAIVLGMLGVMMG